MITIGSRKRLRHPMDFTMLRIGSPTVQSGIKTHVSDENPMDAIYGCPVWLTRVSNMASNDVMILWSLRDHWSTASRISSIWALSGAKFMFLMNIPWKPPESRILMISMGSRKRLRHLMDYIMLRIDRSQWNLGWKFNFHEKIRWKRSRDTLCRL